MLGLVDVPMVNVLVHDKHALLVASVQQRLGAGVVGRTNGVVAVLVQQAYLARTASGWHTAPNRPLSWWMQAPCRMYGLPLSSKPSVPHATLRIPNGRLPHHRCSKPTLQGVQVWVLRVSKALRRAVRVRRKQPSGLQRTHSASTVVQRPATCSAPCRGRWSSPYLHFRRVNRHGAHPNAVQWRYALPPGRPKVTGR